MAEKARKRESWPTFDTPTGAEIKAIAELRGLVRGGRFPCGGSWLAMVCQPLPQGTGLDRH